VADEAYTAVVTAVVPPGLRGLIVAAVLAAIMSTIAGLVNSISTITTLDLFKPRWGRNWTDAQLVRFGQWSGVGSLLLGAIIAPVVMRWDNLFRYCQDIWAPMAAPVVTVFLGAALWNRAHTRGASACLWLAILTIPFTFTKAILGDYGIQFLPANFQNALVFAGTVGLVSLVLFVVCSLERSSNLKATVYSVLLSLPIVILGVLSSVGVALAVAAAMLGAILVLMFRAQQHRPAQWDWSMLRLPTGEQRPWYVGVGLWWLVLVSVFGLLYYRFW
jgi:SSS family solute:Na+ symporter